VSLSTFMCWDPDMHEEADAIAVKADDHEAAAEKFAERRFASDSYPQHRDVMVKLGDEAPRALEVFTRSEPVFEAREKRARKP
jgi:hypothetical protein